MVPYSLVCTAKSVFIDVQQLNQVFFYPFSFAMITTQKDTLIRLSERLCDC